MDRFNRLDKYESKDLMIQTLYITLYNTCNFMGLKKAYIIANVLWQRRDVAAAPPH